jgi:hypothetical protein
MTVSPETTGFPFRRLLRLAGITVEVFLPVRLWSTKLFTVICTLLNALLVTMAATSIDGYLVTVLTNRIVMLLIQQYNSMCVFNVSASVSV